MVASWRGSETQNSTNAAKMCETFLKFPPKSKRWSHRLCLNTAFHEARFCAAEFDVIGRHDERNIKHITRLSGWNNRGTRNLNPESVQGLGDQKINHGTFLIPQPFVLTKTQVDSVELRTNSHCLDFFVVRHWQHVLALVERFKSRFKSLRKYNSGLWCSGRGFVVTSRPRQLHKHCDIKSMLCCD